MTTSISFDPRAYLLHCRACLGICRHCLEASNKNLACHAGLPDTILALEIAILMIEEGSEYAYDRLCYCAEVCAASVKKWGDCLDPLSQLSARACQEFLQYWKGRAEH
ncbi:MAG: hypothetical protein AAGH79_14110 [Bacteroidota bacterium]